MTDMRKASGQAHCGGFIGSSAEPYHRLLLRKAADKIERLRAGQPEPESWKEAVEKAHAAFRGEIARQYEITPMSLPSDKVAISKALAAVGFRPAPVISEEMERDLSMIKFVMQAIAGGQEAHGYGGRGRKVIFYEDEIARYQAALNRLTAALSLSRGKP